MKTIIIDFTVAPKETLCVFPIVKTLDPEEFDEWRTKYIRNNEKIIGIINKVVICTTRGISYALPKGYRFNNDASISKDNSIVYGESMGYGGKLGKGKFYDSIVISDNTIDLFDNIVNINPIIDELKYEVINTDDSIDLLSILMDNYITIIDNGYNIPVLSTLSLINGECCLKDKSKIHEIRNKLLNITIYRRALHKAMPDIPDDLPIDELLINKDILALPLHQDNIPDEVVDIPKTANSSKSNQQNTWTNGPQVVNSPDIVSNNIIDMVKNTIKNYGYGYDVIVEKREVPSKLYNVLITENGQHKVRFVADFDGAVLDPRPKYFPLIDYQRRDNQVDYTHLSDEDVYHNDIGNYLVNANWDYIADDDIKTLIKDNKCNRDTRCYTEGEAELIKLIDTKSIMSKYIDKNGKLKALRSLLNVLKDKNNLSKICSLLKYPNIKMLTGGSDGRYDFISEKSDISDPVNYGVRIYINLNEPQTNYEVVSTY